MKYTLVGLLSAAAVGSAEIPTVNANECSLVFRYKNISYSGCTDIDSEGTPWCLLKKPLDGKQFGYCNLTTIYTYLVDEKRECDMTTPVKGDASVFGCYSLDEQKPYSCMSGGKEMPCAMGNSRFRRSPLEDRASNKTEKSKASSNQSSDNTSLQLIVILSILGGLIVVFVLSFFIIRRSRQQVTPYNKELKPQASQDHLLQTESGFVALSNARFTTNIPGRAEYTVVTIYTPTLSDELVIHPGDRVVVIKEYDDGWVQGANLTRGGAKGVFPKHCIQPLSYLTTNDLPTSKRSSSNNSYKPPS